MPGPRQFILIRASRWSLCQPRREAITQAAEYRAVPGGAQHEIGPCPSVTRCATVAYCPENSGLVKPDRVS